MENIKSDLIKLRALQETLNLLDNSYVFLEKYYGHDEYMQYHIAKIGESIRGLKGIILDSKLS